MRKNRKKYKFGIWGQFGSGEKIADGQAVRTTIITKEMQGKYGENEINILNTNNWSKKPISFFLRCIRLLNDSEKIIIFPADNGFKIFVPIIYIFNYLFKRELYYVVIGGFLPNLLQKKAFYIKILSKFKALFVQTKNLEIELEQFGLNNIYQLTNLKRLEKIDEKDLSIHTENAISVCTFSRVTNTKGIEDAIKGVYLANKTLGSNLINLDIYGVIDKDYNGKFFELLSEYSEMVHYKGVVDYDKTVSVLKKYFVLLFPTFYHGEGFPGNIIDSFYSGLPIIATNWMYNSEIITENVNGFLVPINDPQAICNTLLNLYNDRSLSHEIALNNLKKSRQYTPEIVLKEFFQIID